MTEAAGRARGPLTTAVARGALAFLTVALAAWALSFTEYAATGLYRPWSWVKIGLLYVVASCGVAVDVSGPAIGPGPARVRLALTLGTAVVLWILARAGRATARAAAGAGRLRVGVVAAAGWGALPAIPFAILTGVGSLLVTLTFPGSGFERLRPVGWEAFLLPLAIAAAAGAAGAVVAAAGEPRGRAIAAAVGGWWMFVWALVLAFAAVLVLGAAEPDVTRSYARGLDGLGVGGAVLFGHHVLLIPTQSIDVLAPSMGGSTELVVRDASARLTLAGIETSPGLALFAGFRSDVGPRFPAWYLVFLGVPAAATVIGGRRAARAASDMRERAVRGAWAGSVFGGLVAVASAFSTIAVAGPGLWSGRLGPSFPSVVALAVAWGVAGGVAGAVLRPGTQAVGVEDVPPEPSVTSA